MKKNSKRSKLLTVHLPPSQTNLKIKHSADAKKIPNRPSKMHVKTLYNKAEFLKEELIESESNGNDNKDDPSPFPHHHQKESQPVDAPLSGFVVYPLDLWFILSEYIAPELIGKFALLCKSSHYVTTTVAFYKRLWLRHDPVLKMGRCSELQKKISNNVNRYMSKNEGKQLKPNVIRGLYYYYPLFQSKVKLDPHNEDLEVLYGLKCLMQWHSVQGSGYAKRHMFNFKFKKRDHTILKGRKQKKYTENFWINNEEGCCVLQITCKEYVDFFKTQVSGLIITKGYITVSSNMMSRKVKMIFHKHLQKPLSVKHYRDNLGEAVILCGVMSHQIINWWDPAYPFNNIKHTN